MSVNYRSKGACILYSLGGFKSTIAYSRVVLILWSLSAKSLNVGCGFLRTTKVQLGLEICSKNGSREVFFCFDFHWLSNRSSKIVYNLENKVFQKSKLSKKNLQNFTSRRLRSFLTLKIESNDIFRPFLTTSLKVSDIQIKSGIQLCWFDTP